MITVTIPKACKNCQHWEEFSSDHNPHIGKCKTGNGPLDPECEPNHLTGFTAHTIYEGYAELTTGSDFYCRHFKKKRHEQKKRHDEIFKTRPLGDVPNFMSQWQDKAMRDYSRSVNKAIKARCEDCGYRYSPERMICVIDGHGNELYYYKTDCGTLVPLIALSLMEVKFTDANIEKNITVTLESRELHTDIFKPIS